VLAIVLSASSAEARIFGFGVKAGVDMPKVSVKDLDAINQKLNFGGFHAGILAQLNLPIGLGIQPEVLYVNKNVSVLRFNVAGTTESVTEKGHFVEVPLNITWGIVLAVRPFITVAPTFSYALNEVKLIKDVPDSMPDDLKSAALSKTNWGIGLGAGCDIFMFQIMAKYKWGLSDLAPSGLSSGKYKENTLSISLGYIF
jgi:hypothetical protein